MAERQNGWTLVGEVVRRRCAELGIDSYEEGARRARLSRHTWKRLAEGESVKAPTLRHAERVLGWASGTLDPERLLAGDDPVPRPAAQDAEPPWWMTYTDPDERHIASTPGMSREMARSLVGMYRALRDAQDNDEPNEQTSLCRSSAVPLDDRQERRRASGGKFLGRGFPEGREYA
jgi:hypothetical protein